MLRLLNISNHVLFPYCFVCICVNAWKSHLEIFRITFSARNCYRTLTNPTLFSSALRLGPPPLAAKYIRLRDSSAAGSPVFKTQFSPSRPISRRAQESLFMRQPAVCYACSWREAERRWRNKQPPSWGQKKTQKYPFLGVHTQIVFLGLFAYSQFAIPVFCQNSVRFARCRRVPDDRPMADATG